MPARSAADTRHRILTVARAQFASAGFARTTVRSVAAEVGVDPALVMRYFGSKAGLFAEAGRLVLDLPDLTGLEAEDAAHALVDRFFEIWEEGSAFHALLRASAGDDRALELLRETFLAQVQPALATGVTDRPETRAAMVASQMIGFAFARYVVQASPLVAMSQEEAHAWLVPTVAAYLRATPPGV